MQTAPTNLLERFFIPKLNSLTTEIIQSFNLKWKLWILKLTRWNLFDVSFCWVILNQTMFSSYGSNTFILTIENNIQAPVKVPIIVWISVGVGFVKISKRRNHYKGWWTKVRNDVFESSINHLTVQCPSVFHFKWHHKTINLDFAQVVIAQNWFQVIYWLNFSRTITRLRMKKKPQKPR